MAVNAVKQLDALVFQTVGTDRGGRVIPLSIEVVVQKRIGKIPHGQQWFLDMLPKDLRALQTGRRGHQAMRTVAQPPQMRSCFSTIKRLIEPVISTYQDLITTDDQSIRVLAGNFLSFQASELHRGSSDILAR